MRELAGHSYTSPQGGAVDPDAALRSVDHDTPLTDALLDQFSVFYVISVVAVRALEEARRQRVLTEAGQPPLLSSTANST